MQNFLTDCCNLKNEIGPCPLRCFGPGSDTLKGSARKIVCVRLGACFVRLFRICSLERPYFEGLFAFCWVGLFFFAFLPYASSPPRALRGSLPYVHHCGCECSATKKNTHTPLQRNNAPLRVALCSMHMFAKRDSSRQWKGERREEKKNTNDSQLERISEGIVLLKKASKKCISPYFFLRFLQRRGGSTAILPFNNMQKL